MKVLPASKARELSNKFHKKATEKTHTLIEKNLVKVFNECVNNLSKLGKADVAVSFIVEAFKESVDGEINKPLVDEAVRRIAVENEYKLVSNTIYW